MTEVVVLTSEQLAARDERLLREVRETLAKITKIIGKPTDASGLLTPKMVAARLGISAREFRRIRAEEDFPEPLYATKRPRWRGSVVEAWISSR